jgi:hypothetical protein
MEFISLIIITSLFIVGLHKSTEYYLDYNNQPDPNDRMVLWFLRYYAEQWFPSWIYKPLIGCTACMASIWGSLFYWIHYWGAWTIESFWSLPRFIIVTDVSFIMNWVVFVFAVSATNRIINNLT